MAGPVLRILTEVPAGTRATDHYAQAALFMLELKQPPVFGMGVLRDLLGELKDWGAVWEWVIKQAATLGKPIVCNVEARDTSKTVVIPPPGWTEERVRGYTAGLHEGLEAAFGEISGVSTP